MNKKAGMELSINAIVILIIAMVVLGIGILFIRGLFAKSAEKLTTAISSQEIANPATPDQPVVADKEVLLSRTSTTKTIRLSVFNSGSGRATDVNVDMTHCVTSGAIALSDEDTGASLVDDSSVPYYQLKTAPQDIEKNTYVGYQAIVKFSEGASLAQGDTMVCKLEAKGDVAGTEVSLGSTTITFSVTS